VNVGSGRSAGRWLESAGFLALAALVRAVPRAVARACATRLGSFAFDVVRIRRDVAVRNVVDRLAPAGGVPEAERIARESYRVMARTFVDLLRLDRIGRSETDRLLSLEGAAWFRSFAERGEGAVLVSGHFGNWEIMALAIRRLGLPLRVVAARQANPLVDARVRSFRQRAGIETLSPGRAMRGALRALRGAEFVATLMDQDARSRGTFVEFLGTPASTHTGMLSLAIRARSVVIPGVVVDRGGTYELVLGEPWRPSPDRDDGENVRRGAEHFNRFLEAEVRRNPENYFWAHRRWKSRP
jgi:KDO2-lipid IV(A) lauroyltransferase